MRLLAGIFCAALASSNAIGCTVEEAVNRIILTEITTAGDRARQSLAVLNDLGRLNAKAKDSKKPLSEQLSTTDAAEFGRLSQRQAMMMLYDLIESGHVRNSKVIREIYDVANNLYLGRREPGEKDREYSRYLVLIGLRFMDEIPELKRQNEISVPQSFAVCTLEVGLHSVEQESLEKISKIDLTKDVAELNAISARSKKTPEGKIDRPQLKHEDRAALERLERKMAPALRERQFIADLENLKELTRTADLKYQMQKKDAVDSGGDIKAVGMSIDAMDLDMRTKFYLGLLKKIADDVPSEWSTNMEKMTDAVKDNAAPVKPNSPRSAKPSAPLNLNPGGR